MLTPEELLSSKNDNIIVDARKLADYRDEHIPGAISLPMTNLIRLSGHLYDIPAIDDVHELLGNRGIITHDTAVVA